MSSYQKVLECTSSRCSFSDVQSLGVQETESPGSVDPELRPPRCDEPPLGFTHTTLTWGSPRLCDSLSLSSQESGSDSPPSNLEGCSLAVKALRGSVSQEERCFAPLLFKALELEATEEKEGDSYVNEGILFHPEEVREKNPEKLAIYIIFFLFHLLFSSVYVHVLFHAWLFFSYFCTSVYLDICPSTVAHHGRSCLLIPSLYFRNSSQRTLNTERGRSTPGSIQSRTDLLEMFIACRTTVPDSRALPKR